MFPAIMMLLVVLAEGSPRAVAGPPPAAPGKMVLDDVEDGLRKYRSERNESSRARRLQKLSGILDPRVMMAMAEALTDSSQEVRRAAAEGIFFGYAGGCVLLVIPPPEQVEKYAHQWWGRFEAEVRQWWREDELELRRRAQHPSR
jgi:hypothetical protein